MSATLLAHPLSSGKYSITTDASTIAIGSVLEQLENNQWKPLAFFSKKLSNAEQKYSAFDRELLAIYQSIRHFRHFVEGRDFTIFTDHKPLTTAMNTKAERSPRQCRHLDYISQFTTDIKYIKGSKNAVADALSGPPESGINVIKLSGIDYGLIAREKTIDNESKKLIKKDKPSASKMKLELINFKNENVSLWCETSTAKIRPYLPLSMRKSMFDT